MIIEYHPATFVTTEVVGKCGAKWNCGAAYKAGRTAWWSPPTDRFRFFFTTKTPTKGTHPQCQFIALFGMVCFKQVIYRVASSKLKNISRWECRILQCGSKVAANEHASPSKDSKLFSKSNQYACCFKDKYADCEFVIENQKERSDKSNAVVVPINSCVPFSLWKLGFVLSHSTVLGCIPTKVSQKVEIDPLFKELQFMFYAIIYVDAVIEIGTIR